MFRNKREVDRHVESIRSNIHGEEEQKLRAFGVAKMYMSVNCPDSARKQIDRYLTVRLNSAVAHKLRGTIMLALNNRDEAIESFQHAHHLDQSQTECILKVCELLGQGGKWAGDGASTMANSKARYWLEEGEKFYPRHEFVKRLRKLLPKSSADAGNNDNADDDEDNGNSLNQTNGNSTSNGNVDRLPVHTPKSKASTKRHEPQLFSPGFMSSARLHPNLHRTKDDMDTLLDRSHGAGTPLESSLVGDSAASPQQRRFVPRPSPERLTAQVQSVELAQDQLLNLLLDQNKEVMEHLKQNHQGLMEEMKLQRQDLLDEMKTQRQTVVDLKLEVKQGLHDLKLEMARLQHVLKEGQQEASFSSGRDSQHLKDLKEALDALPKRIAEAMPAPPLPQVVHVPAPTLAPAPAPAEPVPTKKVPLTAEDFEAHGQMLADLKTQIQKCEDLNAMNVRLAESMKNNAAESSESSDEDTPEMAAARKLLDEKHDAATQQLQRQLRNNQLLIQAQEEDKLKELGPEKFVPTSTVTGEELKQYMAMHAAMNPMWHGLLDYIDKTTGVKPANPAAAAATPVPAPAGQAAPGTMPIPAHVLSQMQTGMWNPAAAANPPVLPAMPAQSGILPQPPATTSTFSFSSPVVSLENLTSSISSPAMAKSGGVVDASAHSYQINLPKNVAPMTTSPMKNLDGPAVPITTTAILSTIPAPAFSSLQQSPSAAFNTSTQSNEGSRNRNVSICSQHDSSHVEDAEHDPCPDFQPIIPLPEEVTVVTGEENEDVFHEDRCKLFRYVNKEWKERGLGQIKILKNKTNDAMRVLMRRETTHKVCANHFVPKEFMPKKNKSQPTAVTWSAQDFTDEEMVDEQFTARFKTVEQADKFLDMLLKAQEMVKKIPASPKLQQPSNISAIPTPQAPVTGGFTLNLSAVSNNDSLHVEEPDHDPRPDFKPIIPLPDEVDVVTGEEDEEVFHEDRCKLFRYINKEWKERGLGQIKILKHKESGKLRVLMRRETTHKVCANHSVPPTVTVEKMKKQDLAVTWSAIDFSDEEMRDETFSARFKTLEQSNMFLEMFKKAQELVKKLPASGSDKHENNKIETVCSFDSFKPKAGSWECSGCMVRNDAATIQCPACQTVKPGHEKEVKKEEAAKPAAASGFSFGSASGFKFGVQPEASKPPESKPAEESKVETVGSFDMFKPKPGSWECGGCMVRNPADIIQCPACQTAKPGHEEEVKKKESAAQPAAGGFSFGAGGGFKFGAAATTSTAPATGGFSFTTPASTTTSTTTSSAGGFSFTTPAATTTSTTSVSSSTGGFTFGSSVTAPAGSGLSFTTPGTSTSQTIEDGHLSFENQSLKLDTEDSAKDVAEKIVATRNMTHLTFSGNTIGIDAAKAIGKALESHPEFTHAHWKDMFTGRMKSEIPPALKHLSNGIMQANAHLVELDLSDNAFGPIGMDGIMDLLKSPSCYTLQELKLNNTGCGVTGGRLLAKVLLECYDSSKKLGKPLALKVFVLGRSRQENEGAKALAEVFKLMGSLEEVVMPQNGIYHEGLAALCDAFAHNPNLRILNMSDNTFTFKGAEYLAQALPKLQKLTHLNLDDCLLKTSGAILLAKTLGEAGGYQDLEELHVNGNEVISDGGLILVENVASKPKLKVLSLNDNMFGEEGCDAVRAKLEKMGKPDLLGAEGLEGDQEPDSDDDEDEDGDDENDYEDVSSEETETEPAVAAANTTPANIFGAKPSPKNIFGGAAAPSTPAKESPFKNLNMLGNTTGSTSSASIFGGGSSTASPSIFAAATPTKSNSATPSIFGGASASTPTSSVFGSASKPLLASPSIFGGSANTSASEVTSSSTAKADASPAKPVFGAVASLAATTSPAAPALNGSIFGKPADAASSESKGVDLSESKDLSSFASVAASTGGFAFGKPAAASKEGDAGGSGGGFSFSGAGSTVFGGKKESPSKDKDGGDAGDDEHDPHFEPIIPLPELVQVTTGEEDEEILFKHRAKVFRYDGEAKQWKERGLGDIKLLYHPVTKKYRVLQRREQIHKIACNHLISVDMILKPLNSSDTQLCWFAMDYADGTGQGKMENLAVRFKSPETTAEFKKKFEECQKELRERAAKAPAEAPEGSGAEAPAGAADSRPPEVVRAQVDEVN